MGSGKTSWAIQHMNESPSDSFLYITPFLEETERIKKGAYTCIKLPANKGNGKHGNLLELLENKENIASTHELFKRLDKGCIDTISNGHYTLILDETLDAVQPYVPNKKDDITFLRSRGTITIDKDNYLQWNDGDLTTAYDDIKTLSNNRCLFYINSTVLMWRYPPEIFECFDKVYVMTYLFDSSIMKYYFDLYGLNYVKASITHKNGSYTLSNYEKSDNSVFKKNIDIYQGNMNTRMKQQVTSLSSTWYKKPYNIKNNIPSIKKNLLNYFTNIARTDNKCRMWTTFKSAKEKLKGKGYTNGFVPYNCRATNEYQDKTVLAYCVNCYVHPSIMLFFNSQGIKIDQDKYALSEMLQWIWRSNIRRGGSISLFVQSNRMRQLFIDWLNNKY